MFIQELKLIRSNKSRTRVWSPWTQSRELGDKSPEEKLMWPYTSKFNRHSKNHSLLVDDRVKDILRSRPSLLSHISHTWAYFLTVDLSATRDIKLFIYTSLRKQLCFLLNSTLQCCKKLFFMSWIGFAKMKANSSSSSFPPELQCHICISLQEPACRS